MGDDDSDRSSVTVLLSLFTIKTGSNDSDKRVKTLLVFVVCQNVGCPAVVFHRFYFTSILEPLNDLLLSSSRFFPSL